MGKAEQEKELINGIRQGLLQWYQIQPNSRVLYVGRPDDAVAGMLEAQPIVLCCASLEQTCDDEWKQDQNDIFDYLISVADLERCISPEGILHSWHGLLKEDGVLLLGMNNRFGIRYFCGDRDPYTGRSFDGVEGYRRAYAKKEDAFQGRCYSRYELEEMLQHTGWQSHQFFSVLPDLQNAALVYAGDYLPKEDLANRLIPTYNYPDAVFLEEAPLYRGLIENNLFHTMANAWLIECAPKEKASDVQHVTCSTERGRERAFYTVMHRNGVVEKKAACQEGVRQLEKLSEHARDLKENGIAVVETRMEKDVCVMPRIDAEVGQVYLKNLLQTDVEQFLREMDHFRDLILQSSETVKPDSGDGEGALLRKGYLDLVPLNSFYMDGSFVFYDQEFCEENYPANAIITRMIHTFYSGNVEMEKILPMQVLFERYGLVKYRERWAKMESEFLVGLRKEKELREYHEFCRGDRESINANRQRMNYAEGEYRRLFVDIFRNADTRKLVLFGSGNFTSKFLSLYGQDYPAYAIIDNNRERWGQTMGGVTIRPPEILKELQAEEYKVLICIKNYLSVVKQLEQMGVKEYSIYDSGKAYSREQRRAAANQDRRKEKDLPKRYKTGYIAGVFDLFHVGHLNMFKRAKEQCDYLIVGVVSDEGVRKYKEVEPFIPFEERIELVRACRYVDEAVEIPLNYGGTRDAYRLHHFDCQFSGSDYADHPDWQAEKAFLEKQGAEMVFFPYTESTSSTKLKKLIEQKII